MNINKVTFLFCLLNNLAYAQSTWKFHVAFEDAAGARDTLWMVYDTTAHGNLPVDTALGEGKFNFDYSKMNMWVYNSDFDSTKTLAYPYTAFPNHSLSNIRAFNYVYPITISWDTALFHSSILPIQPSPYMYIDRAFIYDEYFQFVNNDQTMQSYNMLIDNSAIAPSFGWGSTEHFPMTITIEYNGQISVNDSDILLDKIKIFPTFFENQIQISSSKSITSVFISSIEGRILKIINVFNDNIQAIREINTSELPIGTYIVTVIDNENFKTSQVLSKVY